MDRLDCRFEDVDNDGDREIVVKNRWIRVELRVPQHLGYDFYKRRFTWGGRLQSLVYRPTGTEFFLTRMIDLEGINPFGLPDELFQSFEFDDSNGDKRILKMGVGIFRSEIGEDGFEPLPWTWYQEENGDELVVAFRQEVRDVGPYSYVYEKRYRFRADAAWFAMDVILENCGSSTIDTSWDIHSFHKAGVPPDTAWLVAPKKCWSSCGKSRVRTTLKEASPIMATPETSEMVSDRIVWDTDGTPWWYALGPGTGPEFYLLRARFEPYWGMFWAGYDAFTPQGINNVEVPPGDRATFGFDVTVGAGGRNFVAAGEDCGVTIDVANGSARVSAHVASAREGKLSVRVADYQGRFLGARERSDSAAPEDPLTMDLELPGDGDFCQLAVTYQASAALPLHAEELLPLGRSRPTAHLPFDAAGSRVFVAANHNLQHPDADGRYLWCHGTQSGFDVDWQESRVSAPPDMAKFDVACLVGDAWPLQSIDLLARWVEEGGGLLLCAPFGELTAALGEIVPMVPMAAQERVLPSTHIVSGAGMPRYSEAEWRHSSSEHRFERQIHWGTEEVAPVVGLQAGTPHLVARNLMLEPDAKVRIGHWQLCQPRSGCIVPLRYTDPANSPAVALGQVGRGRVAAVASRPAWGSHYHKVVWDGWGQYHRAFFAGLMGWLAGIWEEQ
jgi:hypothetical protein